MSKTTFEISSPYRRLLAAHGLDSFEALFACEGGRYVDGHRDRSVVRLELDDPDGGEAVVIYLKREWNPKPAMLVRRMITHWLRFPPSRSLKEWQNLTTLNERGVSAAEPVALGEVRSGGFFRRALLAVREVPQSQSLAAWLQDFPEHPSPAEEAARHALARELGACVRKLHDAGVAYRDLYAKHIYIRPDRPGGSFHPTLIDAQRAHRFPHLAPQFCWNDLAALVVTTAYPARRRTDMLRFLLAYGRSSRLSEPLKLMVPQIAQRTEKLSGRGLDPNLNTERRQAPPGMEPAASENLVRLDHNRLLVVERFLPELRRLGLDTLDAVMACEGGRSYRDVPDRLTVRIPITGPDGKPSAIYLKRHQRVDTQAWLDGLLKWRKARTRAGTEFANLMHIAACGMATPTPVALGEGHRWSRRQPSFLMTEEIPGGRPADDYLREQFADAADPAIRSRKRRLIREIGRLAHRFHGAGFHHRDFYLCHIFVRETPAAANGADEPAHEWILHLIDLQRVRYEGPGSVGRRWLVKDLAQLNYSAPAGIVTRTDKLRFLREYLPGGRLGADAKALARDVVRKTERIARHDARLRARGRS